jgi:hypothetical protein
MSTDAHQNLRYSRLDGDTLSYWRSMHDCFKQAKDDEDDTAPILQRVFEEMEGQEVDIVCDAECSRILEEFMRMAGPQELGRFASLCLKEDNLGLMCTSSPFGSHVLETMLDRVGEMNMDEVLEQFVEAAAGHLYDMISSKYGSFVARRLVAICSGVRHSTKGDDDQRSYSNRSKYNLADKVQAGCGNGFSGNSNQHRVGLLSKLCNKLMSDELTAKDIHDIQTSPYAGPFLKALLQAMGMVAEEQARSDIVVCLLGGNPAVGADSITSDAMYRLMTDKSGSHLVEAALLAAPDALFTKLCTTAFKGRLPTLSQHQAANFTVQAAIAHVKKPQQLKRMFEDLKDSFVALLLGRRAGIITVLLAAALRLNTLQAECSKTLWDALQEAFSAENHQSPLHSLLTLDTRVRLGKQRGKLSSLGCAAAISIFQFPKGMTKEWNNALECLSTAELAQISMDPGGCRVLESYLGHEDTTPKRKDALLSKIQGSWADIACFGSGNKFVERCFQISSDTSIKKQIASELAGAEERIAATHRGPGLLKMCGVHAIKSDEDNWEKRVKAAEATRAEFEQLFGAGETKEETKKHNTREKSDTVDKKEKKVKKEKMGTKEKKDKKEKMGTKEKKDKKDKGEKRGKSVKHGNAKKKKKAKL